MKKVFAICSAVLAGTALLAFAGCGSGGSALLSEGGLGGGAGTQAEAGAKSAYAFGAVTTAGLLSAATGTVSSLSAVSEAAPETTPDAAPEAGGQTEQQPSVGQETFGEYFELFDTFLNDGALSVQVAENDNTSYDFATKLTVEGSLPDGGNVSYTMYYTETEAGTREEREDDEYEVRVAYDLTGVLEMDGVAYAMTGYRMSETEEERGERETSEELWIRATHPDDADTYVQMNVETGAEEEGGEQETEREYVYGVYRGGQLVERASIDFETENEQGGIETEYELSILKDGVCSRFEVEREQRSGGTVTIGVNYRVEGGGQGRFTITKTADGEYLYRADDGRSDGDLDDDFDD